MRVLFYLTVFALLAASNLGTTADRVDKSAFTKLSNALGKATINQPEAFDTAAENIIAHLIGPPIILGTPDGEILPFRDTKVQGAVIPPELGGPTGRVEEVQEIYNTWCNQVQLTLKKLNAFRGNAHQQEAIEFLNKANDIVTNLHELTLNKGQDGRPVIQLQEGQEMELTNSAYLPIKLGNRGIPERAFQGTIPAEGGAFVLKEFMGIKAILVCKSIPIWQEPWYSRRRIIGYRRVYYIRFVPCEYLKSIVYSAQQGSVLEHQVYTSEHCDSALLKYWNYPLFWR